MFDNAEVIMKGSWIYAERLICNVKIIKWHVLYGSGDYEDPPEMRDDYEVECFYVIFESMVEQGNYNSVRGGFLTISDAITDTETITNQKISWVKV
jgi:hypothetical protein